MYFPQIIVPMFINREPRQLRYSTAALNGLLFGLMLADVAWLRDYPKTPALYSSGVRYKQEPPGQEKWEGIASVLIHGIGDCEDLACWRASEYQKRRIRALPRNVWRLVDGQIRAHAFVLLPDGSTEDPSELLGMNPIGLHRPGRPWPRGQVPDGLWNPPTERGMYA